MRLRRQFRKKNDKCINFINMVRDNPALWDKSYKEFKNISTKKDIWSEIAMNSNFKGKIVLKIFLLYMHNS